MIRKLGLGISVLALLAPGLACALGVGNYQLHSFLNQPLSLDVTLTGAQDLAPEDIIVNLASQQEFDNAGVSRAAVLSDLKFKVTLKGDGTGDIHISTQGPVSEPYMDFLVQILWPTGRILREYTILLDPPSYDTGALATAVTPPTSAAPQPVTPPVSQPVTVSAGSNNGTQPASTTPAPTEPEHPATSSAAAGSSTSSNYTVKSGDTLWQIATHYLPSNNVSVQQMVVAIEKANPNAFYIKGNANFVSKGAVLHIPDESQVREYNTRTAMDHLAQQNRRWREVLAAHGISVPKGGQITAGSNQVQRGGTESSAPSHGEVKLLAAQGGAGKGVSATGKGENAAQLNNQLALKSENVDRLTQENQDLSSRIDALKQQVVTSDKLLKLRNDQIVAMQAKLRELQKQGVKIDPSLLKSISAETAKAPTPAANTAMANTAMTVSSAPAPASVTAGEPAKTQAPASAPMTATAIGEVAAKPAPAKPTAVPVHKPTQPQESGPLSFIMDNLMLVGLVLIGILLVIAGLVMRSRKQAAANNDADVPTHDTDEHGEGDNFLSGNLMDDQGDDGHDDQSADAFAAGDHAEQGGARPAKSGQDPLEELDVYIAYGRFPQAIDFLRNEIAQASHRTDLKVRLLEVEKEAGDNAAFAKDAARFAGDKGELDACIARLGGQPSGEAEPSLDDLESDLSFSSFSSQDKPSAQDGGLDDFGDFQLGSAPALNVGDEIKPSLRDDKPVDFGSKAAEPAKAEDAFELDDAFTLDESELPHEMSKSSLSDADVSAMDIDDKGLDLGEDFHLEEAAPHGSSHDLALELADDHQPAKHDAHELSLVSDDAHEEAGLSLEDIELEEPVARKPEVKAAPAPVAPAASAVTATVKPKPAPARNEDAELDLGGDDDFGFLGDTDENATKLDLARAYIDMGDHDGARDILNEVIAEGSDQQQSEAKELLTQVG